MKFVLAVLAPWLICGSGINITSLSGNSGIDRMATTSTSTFSSCAYNESTAYYQYQRTR
jgi:hypothetical protein